MAEEKTQEVEQTEENSGTEANAGTEGGSKQLTYEEIAAELTKVRREAAGKRVANKELEGELADFRKWKESQMTELEKAQSRLTETEQSRKADWNDIAQAKFGLDDEDMEFIHGGTKEEILASAKKYSERQGRNADADGNEGAQTTRNPNLFPGTRGDSVGRNKSTANDILRDQLLGR